MKRLQKSAGILLIAACAAATASAQISLPGLPVPQLPTATDPLAGTLRTAQSQLRTDVRKLRIR